MLLLTSTSDKLQVVTGSAGTIDVHASWMDNVAGAVAPGRTNTNISAGTTTDVVGSPAASTQRNIKTLHVRNRGAASCDITVQHTDGTTVSQLHKTAIRPGETLQYIDEIGFFGVVGQSNAGLTMNVQTFTASGTYTPTAGTVYAIIECVGGGGGGGGGNAGSGEYGAGGGGGSGGYSRKFVSAAAIGTSQVVTIGAGGAGGTNAPTIGSDGTATSVGSLCVANGGKGGGRNLDPYGGAGGSITGAIGDITAAGAPGIAGQARSANSAQAPVLMSAGGSSVFGGGGQFSATGQTSSGMAGVAGSNYGSGGAGAVSYNTNDRAGGNGSAGLVIITEFIGTLGPALPTNSPVLTGDPQAPTPSVGDNDNSIATTQFVQQNSARVLLANIATTAVSAISTPNGIFTSAYDSYEIDVFVQKAGSGDAALQVVNSIDGGGSYISSGYNYVHSYALSAASPWGGFNSSVAAGSIGLSANVYGFATGPNVPLTGNFRLWRPSQNNINHHVSGRSETFNTANGLIQIHCFGILSGSSPITNLRFFWADSSNFVVGGFIKIYGIR